MKNLFIDTNIVLDLLANRTPFYKDAARLFSLADKGEIRLMVSALTFAITNYVLSKLRDSRTAREILRKFKVLVTVADLNDKIIDLALNDLAFSDFEDALQHYSALEYNAEVMITRNLKDFKASQIPVMTARAFVD